MEKYKNRRSGNSRDAVWTSVEEPQTAAPAKSPQSITKMPDINESIPHSEIVDLEALNARPQSAFMPSQQMPRQQFRGNPMQGMPRNTQSYEGYRNQVYTDTTGNATIGYGHKLTANDIKSGKYAGGITKEQGEALYQQDQAKHNAQLYAREPWIANLSGSQQSAMQDMAFNMGPAFLDKFPGAKKSMKSGDFRAAASSFAGSKYANQVGQRAQDNAVKLLG